MNEGSLTTELSVKILIPARRNSKGVPFKNRKLFKYTANIIPRQYRKSVYVFTDDEVIKGQGESYGFTNIIRNPDSASDESTTKDMMEDFCSNFPSDNEPIVMLYLTYPRRTWEDVEIAIDKFKSLKLGSLLCRKPAKQTPYLMMFDVGDGLGEQVVKHNLSRRQDYRECFELCHYISIILPSELDELNSNLYNKHTYFMKISETVDVDTPEDMECILRS